MRIISKEVKELKEREERGREKNVIKRESMNWKEIVLDEKSCNKREEKIINLIC